MKASRDSKIAKRVLKLQLETRIITKIIKTSFDRLVTDLNIKNLRNDMDKRLDSEYSKAGFKLLVELMLEQMRMIIFNITAHGGTKENPEYLNVSLTARDMWHNILLSGAIIERVSSRKDFDKTFTSMMNIIPNDTIVKTVEYCGDIIYECLINDDAELTSQQCEKILRAGLILSTLRSHLENKTPNWDNLLAKQDKADEDILSVYHDNFYDYPALLFSRGYSHEKYYEDYSADGEFRNFDPFVERTFYLLHDNHWRKNSRLHKLFSGESNTELEWRFDGFGREMNFSRYIVMNDMFLENIENPPEQNSAEEGIGNHVLLKDFSLRKRYEMYDLIIDTAIGELIESKSDSIGLKTLVQRILFGPKSRSSPRPFKDIILMKDGEEGIASVFPGENILGRPVKFTKGKTTVGINNINSGLDIVGLLRHLGVDFDAKFNLKLEDNIKNLNPQNKLFHVIFL